MEIKLLILRITERCNLRCAYCYAARNEEPSFDMDVGTALRAVELCCPVGGTMRIQFTGGEPLLKLDLMEAVAQFGKRTGRRLLLSVQTNGTLLSPDACRRLKAIECGIGVSLDGLAEANRFRVFPDGTPSYDAVVQGIRNLGQVGLRCGLTAVVTNVNASGLGQLADFALYLGNVIGVGLDLFRPLGRGQGQNLAADPEKLTQGVQALAERAEKLAEAGVPFRFRELERLKKRQKLALCGGDYCFAQTGASFAVDGRGDCWPCSSLAGREAVLLGNIQNGMPTEVERLSQLVAPISCKTCHSYSTCLGGCPAGRTTSNEKNELTCVLHRALQERGKI